MTPDELDARLAELGLSEDAFANLLRVEIAQVKGWRAGEEAIPDWAPMTLALLGAFRNGARDALDRRESAGKPGALGMEPVVAGRIDAKLH